MAHEYKLPFTASEIIEKLNKIDELEGGTGGSTGGGVSSWNDLTDKPFYEEVAYIGDTLTWDGTLNENSISPDEGIYLQHVSDSVPTMEQMVGATMVAYAEQQGESSMEITSDLVQQTNENLYMAGSMPFPVFVALADNVDMEGLVFPKKGVYFISGSMQGVSFYIKSLTVPNYEFVAIDIKKIDEKYLPEHSWENLEDKPFYEEDGNVGDTLTWDGVPSDKTTSVMSYQNMKIYIHRISDSVPTAEEVVGGTYAFVENGQESLVEITAETDMDTSDNLYGIGGYIFVAAEDGVSITDSGMTIRFPKKGVYFTLVTTNGVTTKYTKSFTIPNYDFIGTVYHTISPKYLPTSIFGTSGTVTLAAASWDATALTYTLTVDDLGSKDAILLSPVTAEDKSAMEDAEIFTTSADGSVTFTATTVPTTDIQLNYFIVRGA